MLRPSLLPGLIDGVGYNRRRERRDARLFEAGRCFSARIAERRRVAFAWTGAAADEHWSGTARAVDFFDAKGLVETLCQAFGAAIDCVPAERPYLVPGRSAEIRLAPSGEPLGVVGQLVPAVAAARDLPAADEVYVAELDLDPLGRAAAALADLRVQPLPRHPSAVRDLSLEVDERLPAAAVRGTIRQAAPETLASVREFDRYQGKGVPEGKVSLSFRLTFRDPERTLTDAEVQQAMDRIVAAVAASHGATRR